MAEADYLAQVSGLVPGEAKCQVCTSTGRLGVKRPDITNTTDLT
jgi:hypothetical protein